MVAVSHPHLHDTFTWGSAVEIKHAWPCALYLLLLGLLRRPQQCLPRLRLALAQGTATQVSAVKVLSSPLRTDHRKSRGQRLRAILKTLRIQRSLRWPYLWLHCWWLSCCLGSGTLAPHLDGALGVHPSERFTPEAAESRDQGISFAALESGLHVTPVTLDIEAVSVIHDGVCRVVHTRLSRLSC